MTDPQHKGAQRKYRADYQPPAFTVDTVALDFDIRDDHTRVTARSALQRNADAGERTLWLDGRDVTLLELAVDGQPVADAQIEQRDIGIRLTDLPDRFELRVVTRIDPDHNLSLEGLYRSGPILCTQCEATGFSRITYFPDRPDVMARYTVRVEADAMRYPVLLANGNNVDAGTLDEGRHFAVFEDPFAKPCYLFAMVAGDLGVIHDDFTTASGRKVALALYTEHGNEDQCHHAMASLKMAMSWDEATYGLEYDLDRFAIVAVASFNMGAMENKGLNIFNTACIFARADTATDSDFARVRDVVAHEYFHNYTGNRVTCRDWFQLSLKEGLTVFREHQFAIDHGSPGVTRIEQVRTMREVQFPEDAGPRAHPVRPDSYLEMNNFYTITVYEKGAEVIRMMAQIAGREAFLAAVKHYLAKHDGQAVTIEDFVVAMEESTGLDLRQFRRWYAFAGTPQLMVETRFQDGRLTLDMRQSLSATPGQNGKPSFDIPVAVQLFDDAGESLHGPALLRLTQDVQQWRFDDLPAAPTVSILRGFTAPVAVSFDQDEQALGRLMAGDSDPVSRWDAAQSLYLSALVAAVQARLEERGSEPLSQALIAAIDRLLRDPPADRALLAEMLTLPSESRIAESLQAIQQRAIQPLAIHAAREQLKAAIAIRFAREFAALADAHAPRASYAFNANDAGRRRVLAVALEYLATRDTPGIRSRAMSLFDHADNMSDRMAAMHALAYLPGTERDQASAGFARMFAQHPLVMDKWLRYQASLTDGEPVARVRALLADECFDFTNPNRVKSLLGGFARTNSPAFHRKDGSGYELIADEVLRLDAINPQLAAGVAALITPWARYGEPFGQRMKAALARVGEAELSANVREIVDSGLCG